MGHRFEAHDASRQRLGWLAVCLAVCLSMAGAAQAQEKTLAVVLGQPLTVSQVTPDDTRLAQTAQAMGVSKSLALSRLRHQLFGEQVVERLLEDFATQQTIEVDPALVEAFIARFRASHEPTPGGRSLADIAREQVWYWQVEKALYQTYGGTVVYTQQNPRYPVQAYARMIDAYQASGQLTFNNAQYAGVLRRMFAPPYNLIVAPDQVHFDQPWWLDAQPTASDGADQPSSSSQAPTSANSAVEK